MRCPLVRFFTCSACCRGWVCLSCIQMGLALIVTIFGALVAWKPREVIDMQIALYRAFNWRLEPISMEKEIRNTRIMGLAAFIMGMISVVSIVIK